MPHNVVFFEGQDANTQPILPDSATPLFSGPRTVTYKLPTLRAGSYFFHCQAHPAAMQGKLQVRSAS